jgi:hypothetical protein
MSMTQDLLKRYEALELALLHSDPREEDSLDEIWIEMDEIWTELTEDERQYIDSRETKWPG